MNGNIEYRRYKDAEQYKKHINVLLIEDNSDHAALIGDMLSENRNASFDIMHVSCLSIGLETLAEGRTDVVLLDLCLPDSQGLATFYTVHDQAPQVPVVALSAINDEKIAVEAVRAGAQDYLVKGQVDGKLLGHCICYAVERKFSEEALKARQREIEELNTTLERRVQEELEKSRQKDFMMMHQSRLAAMGEMIGNIAHQWKQPLNALTILLYNIKDLCQENGLTSGELEEFFEKGVQLIMKMATTIDDFRNFFKPNKKKELFCVNKVIENSLALVDASFKYNNISVEVDEREEITIIGFPNEYSQVILNVLNNAKDAIVTRGIMDGQIKINLSHEHNSTVLKIKDNGGGIPQDIFNKIFHPYFTTKTEGKGTGMGLYMSKVIIEEHMNGYFDVHNANGGAEFKIITPLAHYVAVNNKGL